MATGSTLPHSPYDNVSLTHSLGKQKVSKSNEIPQLSIKKNYTFIGVFFSQKSYQQKSVLESYLSSVPMYSSVHWTSHFLQGTR